MTVFLIAALSADGFIAKHPLHHTDWTSVEDKEFFAKITKKAGVVVMGANTFKTLKKALPGRYNVVYSREPLEGLASGEGEITQKEPRELLAELEKKGFKEVAIAGGQTIYTMFMEAGLVSKLYLTIEPVLFGNGMTLFNKDLDAKLTLAKTMTLGNQAVLLEYDVW